MHWSISYITDADPSHIRVTTEGLYNAADHAAMVKSILELPFWEPGTGMILDHRSLDFSSSDFQAMMSASAVHAEHDARIGDSRTAIIVGDKLAYGSVRQFLALTEDRVSATITVLECTCQAEAWLRAA